MILIRSVGLWWTLAALGAVAVGAGCGSASVSDTLGADAELRDAPRDAATAPADASAAAPDGAAGAADASESGPDAAIDAPDASAAGSDAAGSGPDAAQGAPDASQPPPAYARAACDGHAEYPPGQEPLRPTGTIHYFCNCDPAVADACLNGTFTCNTGAAAECSAGSDANDGLSASSPKQSIGAVRAALAAMQPGDTVALCRGGAWNVTDVTDVNTLCSGSTGEAGWCDLRDYTPPGHPEWAADQARRPLVYHTTGFTARFDFQHARGFRFWNLQSKSAFVNAQGGTHIEGGAVTYFDICNVNLEGGRAGVWMGGSGAEDTHVRLHDSRIAGASFTAISQGTPGWIIEGNLFEHNGLSNDGTGAGSAHTTYFSGNSTNRLPHMRFANNRVITDSRCRGVVVKASQVLDDFVTENNYISTTSADPNCWSISYRTNNAGADFHRFKIARNRIEHPSQNSAIDLLHCVDCEITDNLTWNGKINVGEWASKGCDATATCSRRVIVRNNTLYNHGLVFDTVGDGSNGDYASVNNVIWNPSSTCYLTAHNGLTLDENNYCRDSATNNSVGAGQLFVNPAAWATSGVDWRPAPGGPLDDAGSISSACSVLGVPSSPCWSATAIGTAGWDPTDPGVSRSTAAGIDIGAATNE